jgi:hypothetical protein
MYSGKIAVPPGGGGIVEINIESFVFLRGKSQGYAKYKLLTTTKQESFHSSYSHRLHDQTKLSARHQEKRLCVGAMFITDASE